VKPATTRPDDALVHGRFRRRVELAIADRHVFRYLAGAISLLTATVTSYFVSADQEQRTAEVARLRGADVEDTQALLRDISDRLRALEDRAEREATERRP
jgi:hypothetical protein